MYIRPRTLCERYAIAARKTRQNGIGRVLVSYERTGREVIGVMAQIRPEELEKLKSLKHETSHVIVTRDEKRAEIGDMLIRAEHKYLVTSVETIGPWVNYFVRERKDL